MANSNNERVIRILLINPNTTTAMTAGMEAAARSVASDSVQIVTYTASHGPDSINNGKDIADSEKAVREDVSSGRIPDYEKYDAVLVACFSVHPLVENLRDGEHVVTGIFEASVLTTLPLLNHSKDSWGIVTTGRFWEKHLSDGVDSFLGYPDHNGNGQSKNSQFAGVYSTGLDAGDFHKVTPEEVRAKLKEATTKLLNNGHVTCVVMGCGGMAGLEDIIRSTAVEVYGKEEADKMCIIDGVKAGIMQLEHTIRSKRVFL